MSRLVQFLLTLSFLIGTPAKADMTPQDAEKFCSGWTLEKLPNACGDKKKGYGAWCDTMGTVDPATRKYNGFFGGVSASVQKVKNLCLAQKQLVFNICYYGNAESGYRKYFADWPKMNVQSMRCGWCKSNKWCY